MSFNYSEWWRDFRLFIKFYSSPQRKLNTYDSKRHNLRSLDNVKDWEKFKKTKLFEFLENNDVLNINLVEDKIQELCEIYSCKNAGLILFGKLAYGDKSAPIELAFEAPERKKDIITTMHDELRSNFSITISQEDS